MKKIQEDVYNNNKFDLILFKIKSNKMDFFKTLLELNNKIELEKIAEDKYQIDSDDEDEDIKYIYEMRETFINKYNKINNRQFKLKKNLHNNF